MKIYSIIFLLNILVAPLHLYPMEKQKLKKEEVQDFFNNLEIIFNESPLHSFKTRAAISKQLDEAKNALEPKKIKSKALIEIKKNLINIQIFLINALEDDKKQQELLQGKPLLQQSTPVGPTSPRLPKRPQKQLPPKPQRQSINIEEFDLSSNRISWKRILSYFSTAGLFTGIGIYSYYKLPEQWHWYRPVVVGLSSLGSITFGYLGYRDWKLSKKFEIM